jgi:hypothetical protein
VHVLGMWLFLALVFIAPWALRWLRERERQKSIRALMRPDGSINEKVLDFLEQTQLAEQRARETGWIRIECIEHAVGWVMIGLSSALGFLVFCLGFPIARLEVGGWDLKILTVTTILTLVLWIAGVYGGYRVYKRGNKHEVHLGG